VSTPFIKDFTIGSAVMASQIFSKEIPLNIGGILPVTVSPEF
jgi:hypothetical protein